MSVQGGASETRFEATSQSSDAHRSQGSEGAKAADFSNEDVSSSVNTSSFISYSFCVTFQVSFEADIPMLDHKPDLDEILSVSWDS